MTSNNMPATRTVSGPMGFAGTLAIVLGGFNILEGILALFNDKYVTLAANGQFYLFDRTGWGWIHILLGLVMLGVGFGILSGQTWARVVGVVLAVIAALIQMLYLPIYPFWALINIALIVFVIYALTLSPSRTSGGSY
jgi:hypothetical protein